MARLDYEINHAAIGDAFQSLVRQLKRKPTTAELATATGLTEETVRQHLKKLKFRPSKSSIRVLTDSVLLGLANRAMKGDPAAAKLYMQLLEGWSERDTAKDADPITNEQFADLARQMVRTTAPSEEPPDTDGAVQQ